MSAVHFSVNKLPHRLRVMWVTVRRELSHQSEEGRRAESKMPGSAQLKVTLGDFNRSMHVLPPQVDGESNHKFKDTRKGTNAFKYMSQITPEKGKSAHWGFVNFTVLF